VRLHFILLGKTKKKNHVSISIVKKNCTFAKKYNMVLIRKKFIYSLIIYIGVSLMFSCKVQKVETVKAAEKKQAKMEWAKAKEDHRTRKKAYKRHLSLQDKATKKRMKNNIKQAKKQNKIKRKDRVKGSCPGSQVQVIDINFITDNQ
jgi:hypothetical protein